MRAMEAILVTFKGADTVGYPGKILRNLIKLAASKNDGRYAQSHYIFLKIDCIIQCLIKHVDYIMKCQREVKTDEKCGILSAAWHWESERIWDQDVRQPGRIGMARWRVLEIWVGGNSYLLPSPMEKQ